MKKYAKLLYTSDNTVATYNISPHDLRRTHARLSHLAGCSMEKIQMSLGHTSLVTTQRYVNSMSIPDTGDYIKPFEDNDL